MNSRSWPVYGTPSRVLLFLFLSTWIAGDRVDAAEGKIDPLSAVGNQAVIKVPDSVKIEQEPNTLYLTKWPSKSEEEPEPLKVSPAIEPKPVSGWAHGGNTPFPMEKDFKGEPGETLSGVVSFKLAGKDGEGDVETNDEIPFEVKIPKIDLKFKQPNGEEVKDEEENIKPGGYLPGSSSDLKLLGGQGRSQLIPVEIPAIDPKELGGHYKFEWDEDKFKLWADSEKKKKVKKFLKYPAGVRRTFYMEALKPSESEGDAKIAVHWLKDRVLMKGALELKLTLPQLRIKASQMGKRGSPGGAIAVPARTEDEILYIVPIVENNDADENLGKENPPKDNEDEKAGKDDDDLVELELELLPKGLSKGKVSLHLPENIRGFDSAGEALEEGDLTVDMENPSGKLKGIRDGKLKIYVEAKEGYSKTADTKAMRVIAFYDEKEITGVNEAEAVPKNQLKLVVLLIPTELAVDANRDGVIKYAGNYSDPDTAGKVADMTTQDKPFRFWINTDMDTDNNGDTVPAGAGDCSDQVIIGRRDLEDFSRLWVYIGGLQEAIAAGDIKIGLKWKNITGTPSINIFKAAETDGGTQYLTSDTVAALQAPSVRMTSSVPNKDNQYKRISGKSAFILNPSFWGGLSSSSPNKYLIFEGCTEGKAELVVTFHKSDGTEISEGPGVWLDLKNIKKMYQRYDAATAHPWENVAFESDPNEEKHVIIFVHGWRMSPEGASNFAETFYKRLWHRGYKGRFAAFHWDTWYYEAFYWVPYIGGGIDAYLSNYNDSEYTAWQSAAALRGFVNGMPSDYKRHLAAHSMGNIVAGEAIRQGMNVSDYALMQAAVPSACYDDNEARIKQTVQETHYNFVMWDNITPDDDPDPVTRALAYRGRFMHANFANVNMISFFLPSDYATFIPWEVNNDQTKPENGLLAANYRYIRNNASGKKWLFAELSG